MSDKTLYILRGVSNSGKTTLAETLCQLPCTVSVAADDYFYDEYGNYNWKAENLGKAHNWCKDEVETFMCRDYDIVLHNTNTSEKELSPYLELAALYGYKVVSLIVEKRHDNFNNHNIPEETLKRQERKLRNSIKLL